MKILVANLGSTSFKYRLFNLTDDSEEEVASGGYERVSDYGEVIDDCLQKLMAEGAITSLEELDAVGFKTVMGKDLSGCVADDDAILAALDGFADLAPAHNPAYAAGVRTFREKVPNAVRVALFETAFYQWVSKAARIYALPKSWRDLGIERMGFHGASHKYIAERSAEMLGRPDVAERVRNLYVKGPGDEPKIPLRIVSCHLGGSSSVTGTLSGVPVDTSMGFSPQSGLPQNNRVGDLDAMAIPYAMAQLGIDVTEAVRQLGKESGLLGISCVSNDMRDLQEARDAGNEDARLAIDHLVHSIRKYIGIFTLELNGLDALVFTGGMGEKDRGLRKAVCRDLDYLGLELNDAKNEEVFGCEGELQSDASRVKILVCPTNEELVVAREARRTLLSRQV